MCIITVVRIFQNVPFTSDSKLEELHNNSSYSVDFTYFTQGKHKTNGLEYDLSYRKGKILQKTGRHQ